MYVQVEFKVIEAQAGAVARAANVNEDRVLAGLNRLWHWAWVQKNDVIDVGQLAGVFGGERIDALAAAMVAQGFLEARPDDWRIRGAERYLRIRKTRSDNAKRTNEKRWKSDDGASQVRRNSDASTTQPVALTLSTETLSTEHLKDLSTSSSATDSKPSKKAPKAKPQKALPLEPTTEDSEEEPERKPSEWLEALDDFESARTVAARELGLIGADERLPEEPVDPRRINAMLSKAAKLLSELQGYPVAGVDLGDYFDAFGSNERFATYDPPWPLVAFCHPGTLAICARAVRSLQQPEWSDA